MRRVNFHLTDRQIERLQQMSEDTGLSSAELIRRAIDGMIGEGQGAAPQVRWTTGGTNRHGQTKATRTAKRPRVKTAAGVQGHIAL